MRIELFWRRLAAAVLLGSFAAGVLAEERINSLDNVRIGLSDERTRLVFDVSAPLNYSIKQVEAPYGLRIDMADMELALVDMDISLASTPISSIEFSRGEDGVLHAILKINVEVDHKAFTLRPYQGRGHRLVLDIHPRPVSRQLARESISEKGNTVAVVGGGGPAVEKSKPAHGSRGAVGTGRRKAASPFRWGGTWEQEAAIETGGGGQKFEALIEPRLDLDLPGNAKLTALARFRLDAVGDLGPDQGKPRNYTDINGPWYNTRFGEVSLREIYIDTRWGSTYWRLGKQQVVWGQADGIKVLDVVNPQSFREYILDDFDDSRIPLYMAKMEAPLGKDLTLQLLWIPDNTYHELAEPDRPFFLTSPQLVPVAPPGLDVSIEKLRRPNDLLDDSDIGGRISGFLGGWDVTLNYLYQYRDFPVFYQQLAVSPEEVRGVLSPTYERSHMTGGTLSNAFGDFTVRTEVAYNTDSFHVAADPASRGIRNSEELASVLGIDWQLGRYDTLLSVQWFQSHLFDYEGSITRDETEQYASLYYQKSFARETWVFSALALYSLNHHDSLSQLKLKHLWLSNVELWFGADIFLGDREGVFGQFRDQSRVLLGFELGF